MLTLFACPKPFDDPHTALIQRNAITSWTHLVPRPQIVLLGDEAGTSHLCRELDLTHVPGIASNEYGTPLLDHVFREAQCVALHDTLCYVNADIILTSDFVPALSRASQYFDAFLLTGQRHMLAISEPIDYSNPQWETGLRRRVGEEGYLDVESSLDYFVFRRGAFDLPAFAIGRIRWDNWLIWRALSMGMPVVDATKSITVIHQVHDHAHVGGEDAFYFGIEARQNLTLAGGASHLRTLLDATHVLTATQVRSAFPRKVGVAIGRPVYRLLAYKAGPLSQSLGLRRGPVTIVRNCLGRLLTR
jgi:hypothetical protein